MSRVYPVLCTGRTGSWYLLGCLNSIPGVRYHGELLNPAIPGGLEAGAAAPERIEGFLRSKMEQIDRFSVGGFKLPLEQLRDRGISLSFVREVCRPAGWIILYREDLFAQFISGIAAAETNVWVRRRTDPAPRGPLRMSKHRFDEDRYLGYTAAIRRFYEDLSAALGPDEKRVWVRYEDLAQDAQGVFDGALFDLIGVPRAVVHCDLTRIGPTAEDVFTNPRAARVWADRPESRHLPVERARTC